MALKAKMSEKTRDRFEYSHRSLEANNMSCKEKVSQSSAPDQSKPAGKQIRDAISRNTRPKQTTGSTNQEQTRNYNPYTKATPRKCYRRANPRHRSNECPTRKPLNLVEPEGESKEEEEQLIFDDDACDVTRGVDVEEKRVNLVLQRIMSSPKQEEPPQRRSIFRSLYSINKKVCDLIVDNGSCDNFVAKKLVDHRNCLQKLIPCLI